MWDDTDDLLIYLFLVAGAVAGGPSLLAVLGVDVGQWCIQTSVLVASEQSVVTLPLVGAGLDWRRLALVGLLVAALLTVAVMRLAARRRGVEVGG